MFIGTNRFIPAIVMLLLATLLSSCSEIVKTPTTSQTEVKQDPSDLLAAGDLAGAAALYQQWALQATPPRRQEYLIKAADLLLQTALVPEAQRVLEGIDPQTLDTDLKIYYELLVASTYISSGDAEKALVYAPTLGAEQSRELRAKSHALRAEIYASLGDYHASIQERVWLDFLLVSTEERQANHIKTWQLLKFLTPNELLQHPAPAPDILSGWLDLANIARHAPLNMDQVELQILHWQNLYPSHPASEGLLDEIRLELHQFKQRPNKIALLLPLSGKLAGAAKAIRDGFLASHYQQAQTQEAVSITIHDTTQYQSDIWSLYKSLTNDGIEFVVGPLQKEIVQQFAEAGQLDLPILALNSVTAFQPPENLYQFGLSSEDEARQVAERAILDGLNQSITLTPTGDWGNRVLQAFTERLTELGGEVLEQVSYPSTESDFSRQITPLLNIDQSQNRGRALRRTLGKEIQFEPRRRQDVDFVFLAAFPRQARSIVPQFQFHHAADIPIYATSHIYQGTVDTKKDRDMNGTYFCDSPWSLYADNGEPKLHHTLSQFWPAAMQRFSRFYALGIDAYNILPYLTWLTTEDGQTFPGISGNLKLDHKNHIQRELQWARFIDGKAQILTDSPILPSGLDEHPQRKVSQHTIR